MAFRIHKHLKGFYGFKTLEGQEQCTYSNENQCIIKHLSLLIIR